MLGVVCSSQSSSPGSSGWCSGYLQAECLWNKVIKWKISLLSTWICKCYVQKTDEFWFHFWFLMTTNNWVRKIIIKNCNCLQFKKKTGLLSSSVVSGCTGLYWMIEPGYQLFLKGSQLSKQTPSTSSLQFRGNYPDISGIVRAGWIFFLNLRGFLW